MNRITSLRKEKGMSQISLALKLNVSQKMISAYKTGKSEPSISTLKNMADIFNASIDYITGYSDIRQPINKLVQSTMTENECNFLNSFRELSSKQQYIALGVISGLKATE